MNTINVILCAIIFALGAVVLRRMWSARKLLNKVYERVKSAKKETSGDYNESVEAKGDVVKRYSIETRYDRKQIEDTRNSYYKAYADYVVCSQLISIFPLLGIFGTVFGLVFSGNSQDISQLVGGLSMALWTTLVGLIFSIALKIFDATSLGRLVNHIDAEFEKADAAISHQLLEEEIGQVIARKMDKR